MKVTPAQTSFLQLSDMICRNIMFRIPLSAFSVFEKRSLRDNVSNWVDLWVHVDELRCMSSLFVLVLISSRLAPCAVLS